MDTELYRSPEGNGVAKSVIRTIYKNRHIPRLCHSLQHILNFSEMKIFFCFFFLTHERSHRVLYWDFCPGLTTFPGLLTRFVQTTGSMLASKPTLSHQHRANNQYRTTNLIKPRLSVNVNSRMQTTREQRRSLPSKLQLSFMLFDFSDHMRTGISKLTSPLSPRPNFIQLTNILVHKE